MPDYQHEAELEACSIRRCATRRSFWPEGTAGNSRILVTSLRCCVCNLIPVPRNADVTVARHNWIRFDNARESDGALNNARRQRIEQT